MSRILFVLFSFLACFGLIDWVAAGMLAAQSDLAASIYGVPWLVMCGVFMVAGLVARYFQCQGMPTSGE